MNSKTACHTSTCNAYLSWDKDFIALAKKSIQIMRDILFILFLEENICYGYSLEAPYRGASN